MSARPTWKSPDTSALRSRGTVRCRRLVPALAIATLLVLIAGTTVLMWTGQQAIVDQQNTRIAALEERLRAARQEQASTVEQDLLHALGISRHRTDADTRKFATLIKTAFTWDSGLSYELARTTLTTRFGLGDDDMFLREFMPPARYNQDSHDKRYYYIDAQGLNSAVSGEPEVAAVSAAGGDYTYVAFPDIEITSDAIQQNNAGPARVTTTRRIAVFVTINAQGGMSGLSAAPAPGPTRLSK
ncbi:hypothetical protein ACIQUM_07785 [Amycolatopsis azurea]|uniref:hypothetical protein n=1 Tax=Amycolatopsis azurea TaxID=36819 RepID=UPI0037F8823E